MGRVFVNVGEDFDAQMDEAFRRYREENKPEKPADRKTSIMSFVQKMSSQVKEMQNAGYNAEQVVDAVRSVAPEEVREKITPKLISQSMTRMYRLRRDGTKEEVVPELSIAAKVFGTIKEKIGCEKYFISWERRKPIEVSTPEDVEKLMLELKKISKTGVNLFLEGRSDKYYFENCWFEEVATAKKFRANYPACFWYRVGDIVRVVLRMRREKSLTLQETDIHKDRIFWISLPSFPVFVKEGKSIKVSAGGSQVKDITCDNPPPRPMKKKPPEK